MKLPYCRNNVACLRVTYLQRTYLLRRRNGALELLDKTRHHDEWTW